MRAAVSPVSPSAAAVASAMKGWLPNSMVSASGTSCSITASAPTTQPERSPGAA